MYIAAIDLGTNCFRLLIAKIELNQIIFVQKTSIITGLGKDFDTNNKLLSKKSISRSLKVLKKFSLTLKRFQISSLRAVATSVVRNSDNSQDFIKQASSILNTKIEIISGKKEAELTTIGVLNSVNITPGNKIVVDIGGGSTEFGIVDENEKINFECSINLGVVSIAEKFNLRKPISGEVRTKISDHIVKLINRELNIKEFNKIKDKEIIVTAGTPTTLAAIDLELDYYDADRVNGHRLKKKSILSILNRLCRLSSDQRLNIKGLFKGREDLIIPGTLIIMELLTIFDENNIIVSDGGLLEGLIYSKAHKLCNNSMQL